jgi:DNA-binding NarL/FixJ family response regulator
MGNHKTTIYVLSDQQLRGKIIQNLLKTSFADSFSVSLLGSANFHEISSIDYKPIFIIDFIGLNVSAKLLIDKLKKTNKNAKLIALHLYRSASLVKPLFDMGIDGYVYYEPTRAELIAAVNSVKDDNNYMPTFLGTK